MLRCVPSAPFGRPVVPGVEDRGRPRGRWRRPAARHRRRRDRCILEGDRRRAQMARPWRRWWCGAPRGRAGDRPAARPLPVAEQHDRPESARPYSSSGPPGVEGDDTAFTDARPRRDRPLGEVAHDRRIRRGARRARRPAGGERRRGPEVLLEAQVFVLVHEEVGIAVKRLLSSTARSDGGAFFQVRVREVSDHHLLHLEELPWRGQGGGDVGDRRCGLGHGAACCQNAPRWGTPPTSISTASTVRRHHRQCPFPYYRAMQQAGAVFPVAGTDLYLVTRHELILPILRDQNVLVPVRHR